MPSKLQFYTQMADHTARQITGSFGEWTAFLETAGRLYKYPFHEQLMIFAQKPNATACADYDLWNKQMGRYVRRGSKCGGGKGRIYKYLTESHNSKEKAAFLKGEFGLSGSSHAVSGRGWREASGKGIKLQKPNCANVELNWNKVLERYENLIRNGRYFTPEEKAEYEEMQTDEWKSRQSYNNYNDIKHEHPDDIVLFQVGDFFEMYGEDAKTAANILDLHLTTRPIAGAGRVEMCGVPAHALEQYVVKLRAINSVTIAAINSVINEHIAYVLPAIIPREEWQAVQELRKRHAGSGLKQSEEYPFTNMLICPYCGKKYGSYTSAGHNRELLNWYRCKSRHDHTAVEVPGMMYTPPSRYRVDNPSPAMVAYREKYNHPTPPRQMICSDIRIPFSYPQKVFVRTWNQLVSKKTRYQPILQRTAETTDNALTRLRAKEMIERLDTVGRLDGFDYALMLRTLDFIEVHSE